MSFQNMLSANRHTGVKLPTRDQLRIKCRSIFIELQEVLELQHPSIFVSGPDIHYIGRLPDGKYIHLRTWVQHMYDCLDHKRLVAEGKIFIGGYIRESADPGIRKSREDGEDAMDYGEVFFHYGWFQADSSTIANIMQVGHPKYFPEQKIATTREVTRSEVGRALES